MLRGDSALETSNGVVASLHVYCTIPNLVKETELFGPLWLAEDIVQEPVKFRD